MVTDVVAKFCFLVLAFAALIEEMASELTSFFVS